MKISAEDAYGVHRPLRDRAWTQQEQLLVSKMVHFIGRELNSSLASRGPIQMFTNWLQLVVAITLRNITEPKDMLPCLSGLAKRFQDSGADLYLAGLWLDKILRGLLWICDIPTTSHARASPYRGPSWSWVSVTGRIYFPVEFKYWSGRLEITTAKVLEAKCNPGGMDPLGAVSNGYLKMAAPVLKMVLDAQDRSGRRLLRKDGKAGLGKVFVTFDFEFMPKPNSTLSLVMVGKAWPVATHQPWMGLVLRQVQDDSGVVFERIGMFKLDSEQASAFLEGLEDSIVTIV